MRDSVLRDEQAAGASREVASKGEEMQALFQSVDRLNPREIAQLGEMAARMSHANQVPGKQQAMDMGRSPVERLSLHNVDDCFTYHEWTHEQSEAGGQVRDALVMAAKTILRVVPEGPDRNVALRKLREARMDANSAITHRGRF